MTMCAREVRQLVKTFGYERGGVKAMEALAEELTVQRQQITELATIIDKLADVSLMHQQQAIEMGSAVAAMRRLVLPEEAEQKMLEERYADIDS